MADRYRTPDGWTVEVLELAEGDRLRIRHHGSTWQMSLTSMTLGA